jgi:hypothetical protein
VARWLQQALQNAALWWVVVGSKLSNSSLACVALSRRLELAPYNPGRVSGRVSAGCAFNWLGTWLNSLGLSAAVNDWPNDML